MCQIATTLGTPASAGTKKETSRKRCIDQRLTLGFQILRAQARVTKNQSAAATSTAAMEWWPKATTIMSIFDGASKKPHAFTAYRDVIKMAIVREHHIQECRTKASLVQMRKSQVERHPNAIQQYPTSNIQNSSNTSNELQSRDFVRAQQR